MIGKTISHYKILEKLGEGGMGEVYKAKDIKLNRVVALKFLHPESLLDKAKKASLLQEAQAAAAINHPNISVVYEINESKPWLLEPGDDYIFIAMEYIEGQNLKEKIQSGSLNIDNAIDIALQIAEGLQEIHDKGMVHRDIKSDNIRITKKGQVKILDFGLVKTSRIKEKISQEASTCGTLAYMSPEQIRGEEIDYRSDIWSWGIVFYEMITGQLPFKTDKDDIEVIYLILDEEPQYVRKICPDIPSEYLHVLDHALEKDPAKRYQSMKDILIDLKGLKRDMIKSEYMEDAEQVSLEQPSVSSHQKRKWIIIGASLLMLTAIVIMIILFKKFTPASEPKVSVLTSYTGLEHSPALSPDGNKLAFNMYGDSISGFDIFIKLIGENDHHRFTSDKGFEYSATWSQDGNTLAYIRYREKFLGIFYKPFLSGREIQLHTFDSSLYTDECWPQIDWSWDGQWLVFNDFDTINKMSCLFRLNVETLEKKQLTFPGSGYLGDMNPKYSPNGKFIAFKRALSYAIGEMYIIKLKNRKVRQLTFDGKEINGLAWMPNSREIVFSSKRDGSHRLWRISKSGGNPELLSVGEGALDMSISRSGNRIAYSSYNNYYDIWKADLFDTPSGKIKPYKFIISSKSETFGVFSPDGESIAFGSDRTGNYEIWTCNRDGSNLLCITSLNSASNVPRWSPDGQYIVFDSRPHGHSDIMIVDAQGIKPPNYLTDDPSDDRLPSWSSDGQWIYFGSNRTGRFEIFKVCVQDDKRGNIIQVTSNGGFFGYESPDKRWFYFKKYKDINGPIYRLDLEKSEESIAVIEQIHQSRWIVANEGIYYIVSSQNGNPILKLYRFSSDTVEQVKILDQWLYLSDISNDRQTILLWKGDISSDIYMVENFR